MSRRIRRTLVTAAVAIVVMAAGPATTAGSLTAIADMSEARMAHTATLLADGRVLVAGGFTEAGSARGAQAYDAATRRFSPLPPMLTTRHSHTATRLRDGRVLIVGGLGAGNTTLATAEIFNPVTNTFSPAGTLQEARAGHVAVLLDDGRILLAGGLGLGWTFLSSAELYDPASGTFSRTGSMTAPRESHVGLLLRDGRAFIVGGHRGRRSEMVLYSSAEAYDPRTGRFSHVADMSIRRHKHDAVLLQDGRVLVTGGSTTRDYDERYASSEIFDPAAVKFSDGPTLNRPRYKHAGSSVLLQSGQVLIAGGATEAEVYDARTKTFSIVAGSSRLTGHFSAVAPLADGNVLITGGYGSDVGPRATAWLYRR